MQNAGSHSPQQAVCLRRNGRVITLAARSAAALAALGPCHSITDAAKTKYALVVTGAPGVESSAPPDGNRVGYRLDECALGPIVFGMTYSAANDSL